MKPTTGIAGCCARVAIGHVAAAPPRSVRNLRRRSSPNCMLLLLRVTAYRIGEDQVRGLVALRDFDPAFDRSGSTTAVISARTVGLLHLNDQTSAETTRW